MKTPWIYTSLIKLLVFILFVSSLQTTLGVPAINSVIIEPKSLSAGTNFTLSVQASNDTTRGVALLDFRPKIASIMRIVLSFDDQSNLWTAKGTIPDLNFPDETDSVDATLKLTLFDGARQRISSEQSVAVLKKVIKNRVVPDVLGLTHDEGKATIIEAQLTVGTITTATSDTIPVGAILSQQPAAGTEVKTDSVVDIVISNGPDDPEPLDPPVASLSSTITADPEVTVFGTAPGASQVRITGGASIANANVTNQKFSTTIPLIPNQENQLFVTAITEDGTESESTPATIVQDSQPPELFIDFPIDGAETTNAMVNISGRVSDPLSGFMRLTVDVVNEDVELHSQPVKIVVEDGGNGTFERTEVPLTIGPNTISVTATDRAGNSVSKSIIHHWVDCQKISVNTIHNLYDTLLRFENPQIYDPTKTILLGDHFSEKYTEYIWGEVIGGQPTDYRVELFVTTDIDYRTCFQDGNDILVCTAPVNQFDTFFSETYSSSHTGPVSGHLDELPTNLEYSNLVVHVFSVSDRAYFQQKSDVDDNGNWAVTNVREGEKMIEVYKKGDVRWGAALARGYLDIGGTNEFVFPKSDKGFKSVRLVRKPDNRIVAEDYEIPKLPRSYHLDQDHPEWKILKDRTFLYDIAVGIIASVNLRDQTSAEFWVGGLLDAQENDGQFPFSVNRKSGFVPEAKFRTGSQFWNVYSLLWFLKHYPESELSESAWKKVRKCLDRLINLYRVEEKGLQQFAFRGGPDVTWCSTEHNIDAVFTLFLAGDVFSDPVYTTIGNQVLEALQTNFWDDENERAYQGITSQTEVDPNHALDVGSWYSILMRTVANDTERANKALNSTKPYMVIDGEFNARGYTPYLQEFGYPDAKGGIWGEGTAGVILAMSAAQKDTCSLKASFNELLKLNTDEGLLYVTIPDKVNQLIRAPSLASTAWAIIAGKPNGFWNVNKNFLNME